MPDTKVSLLTAASALGMTDIVPVVQAGASKRASIAQVIDAAMTRIAGPTGVAGAYMTWQTLTANATGNLTVTPAVVMTTSSVPAGTYTFKYTIIYQSTATTTGVGFSVNHTGTTGRFASRWSFGSTGGAAATGISDQISIVNAGQLMEQKSERVKATVSSSTAGVATINADQMAIMEGLIVVSTVGDLQLRHNSETAVSTSVMANSSLVLTKIA